MLSHSKLTIESMENHRLLQNFTVSYLLTKVRLLLLKYTFRVSLSDEILKRSGRAAHVREAVYPCLFG